jgi:hypothetical protein
LADAADRVITRSTIWLMPTDLERLPALVSAAAVGAAAVGAAAAALADEPS